MKETVPYPIKNINNVHLSAPAMKHSNRHVKIKGMTHHHMQRDTQYKPKINTHTQIYVTE